MDKKYKGALSAKTALPLALSMAAAPLVSAQMLEEVLVTAERRVESLQDTPLSITALSSESIEKRGIANADDIFATMPAMGGFSAPGSRGATSLSIRGASGGSSANVSIDPVVAMYLDGVYVGKMLGTAMDVAQIERIEVLRGPQGTLYGRNATAGAINVITRKPLGEFAMDVTASAGNYNYRMGKVNLDFDSIGKVGEGAGKLSTALSVVKKTRDGFYDNYSGGDDFDDLDRLAWRAALRWEPSEHVTVDYAYDYSDLDEVGALQQIVAFTPLTSQGGDRLQALQGALADAQGYAAIPGTDSRISSRWIPSLQKSIAAYQAVKQRGEGRAKGGWADNVPTSENESDGHALTAEWRLGEQGRMGDVTLKSITAYREITTAVTGDLEDMDNSLDANGIGAYNDTLHLALNSLYGPSSGFSYPQVDQAWASIDQLGAGFSNQDASSGYEQFSQEFQLLGATPQLDYALGLFWYEDESDYQRNSSFLMPLAGAPSEQYRLEGDSLALYGQGTYRFAELDNRLAITAGLRYTEESKSIRYNYGAFQPFLQPTVPARRAERDNNFYNFSYSLTVAYDLSEDINAFARLATGYRSGGFNGEVFDNPFDEEEIEQLEVGFKSDWLNNRLRINGSLFAYTYDDLQTSSVIVSSNGSTSTSIINAGKAERWGGELEVFAVPMEAMVLSLSYSYINGDFEEFPDTCNANGDCIVGERVAKMGISPPNKLTASMDYTFARTPIGELNLFVNAAWQDQWQKISVSSSVINDFAGNPTPYAYDRRPMDERTVVNARLSLNKIPVSKGELSLSLWGNNLTDDDYPTFGVNFMALGIETEQYGAPRTYGLELRYRY